MFKLPVFCWALRCMKVGGSTRSPILVLSNSPSLSSAATVVVKSTDTRRKISSNDDNNKNQDQRRSNMVAAAFASLQSTQLVEDEGVVIKTPQTDDKISKAQTVHELLSITDGNGISRRHAFKVVSVLADWTSSGKAALAEFEADARFIKLCRVLTKSRSNNNYNNRISTGAAVARNEDLNTVLNVAADDEAAKLVGSITLPQMVKVMTTLAQKKRRPTFLLRSISYNITAKPERLNLKQCADLFYSMAVLNFIDENLLNKCSNDTIAGLNDDIKSSAVIGSISTSVGLLKYKNSDLLEALSEWILKRYSSSRPQDLFGFLMTLAVLNYKPSNSEQLFEALKPDLSYSEARKPLVWLDTVWSLVLLNKAQNEDVSSVLDESFIEKIEGSATLNTATKLKLLNIDGAAAHLLHNYNLNRLPANNSSIRNVQISRSKEKTEIVESMIDSLRNLIRSDDKLRTNINTGLGFFIDAECVLDKKCNPLPLSSVADSSSNKMDGITRVAIVTCDYHDMCKGEIAPSGITAFVCRILESKGYKVIRIPYTEFRSNDKLIHRVRHLESKLKETVVVS